MTHFNIKKVDVTVWAAIACMTVFPQTLFAKSRPTPGPAIQLTTEVIPLDIWFGQGKAVLKRGPHNAPVLKKLAPLLQQTPIVHIEIEGSPDAAASPATNKALSLRRAEALRDSFPSLYGIPADRIQVEAAGESVPEAQKVPSKPDLPLPLYLILYRVSSGTQPAQSTSL